MSCHYHVGAFSANKPSEDCYYVSRDGSFFGVYDGHGGKVVSEYLRTHLYPLFQSSLKLNTTPEEALTQSFLRADEDYLKSINPASPFSRSKTTSGSCAVVVYIHGDKVYTANVGDSRAIVTKKSRHPISLSKDQTTTDKHEQTLVIERTGDPRAFFKNPREVEYNPTAPDRLLGHLMVTRAFGDAFLKVKSLGPQHRQQFQFPYVTAEPVVTCHTLSDFEDEFVVLASDGLWDLVSNEEVADFLNEHGAEWDRANIAQKLVDYVFNLVAERNNLSFNQLLFHPNLSSMTDDITVIVVNPRKRKT